MTTIHGYKDETIYSMADLLKKRNVRAKLRRVVRGPRVLTVDLRLADQDEYKKAAEIARPLSLSVGAQDIIAYPYGGVIRYEVQLPEAMWRVYGIDELQARMSIGITTDKQEIGFSLGRPTTMVIGESGSGKSNLVHAMMVQAMRAHTPDDLRIGLLDPHGGFNTFADKAHLAGPPAQATTEIADVLGWFKGEFEKRKKMGEARVAMEKLPILWLVADECSSADVIGEKGAINEDNLNIIRPLVKEGRKFGFRTMLITQKPTEADMPGILSIATNRYVGRVSKAVGANLANSDTARPHQLTGKGDFFHVSPVETRRFQAAMVTENDYNKLPDGQYNDWPVGTREWDDQPVRTGGRPRQELQPEIVARYIQERITRNGAKERWGFGQTIHERYAKFAQKLSEEIGYGTE